MDSPSPIAGVPVLTTARLRLRPHRREDFEASAAMWADPDVVRYITGTPFSAEASWARLLRYGGLWPMLGYGYWVVETRQDGAFVGEVGFADFRREVEPPTSLSPEAGWAFRSDAHGKGYASEATACMFEWADRALGAAGTFCILNLHNAASVRVARKAGFEDQATIRLRGAPTTLMRRPRDDRQEVAQLSP